jgi:cation:H+ antiporter
MPVAAAIPLFAASLAVTLAAARLFARRLDRLGVRLRLPEALIGLLTALGADGPEISSALYALIQGAGGVSVGVLVGSNAFNLAAMIGASALLSGRVRLARRALLVEGLTCGIVTALGCALLLGWTGPAPAAVGSGAVLVPYLTLLLGRRSSAPRELPPPPAAAAPDPTHHLLGLILLDVALIVAGSAGMVQSTLALGAHWQIARGTLGTLVLGPLTSLPNAATAIRLGLAGRGPALVGETFNSNTINLAAGLMLPALFVAPVAAGAAGRLELGWMAGMTAAALVLLARRGGLGRLGAGALILAYAGFAAVALAG